MEINREYFLREASLGEWRLNRSIRFGFFPTSRVHIFSIFICYRPFCVKLFCSSLAAWQTTRNDAAHLNGRGQTIRCQCWGRRFHHRHVEEESLWVDEWRSWASCSAMFPGRNHSKLQLKTVEKSVLRWVFGNWNMWHFSYVREKSWNFDTRETLNTDWTWSDALWYCQIVLLHKRNNTKARYLLQSCRKGCAFCLSEPGSGLKFLDGLEPLSDDWILEEHVKDLTLIILPAPAGSE